MNILLENELIKHASIQFESMTLQSFKAVKENSTYMTTHNYFTEHCQFGILVAQTKYAV